MNNEHNGFSVVELAVVISVIAILTALVTVFLPSAQLRARDVERRSDAESIARFFEQRYIENASSSYPTYPSVASLTSDTAPLTNGSLSSAVFAPGATTSSLSTAANNGDISASVTKLTYIYQPLLSNGNLCTTSDSAQPCVRFKLWYRLEENNPAPIIIESKHQQ